MDARKLGGFLPVTFKIGDESSCDRQIFVKQNDSNSDIKPSDRTLFIINVPQCIDHQCIRYMYKNCGGIEKIYFHSKPKSSEEASSESTCFSSKVLNIGYKVAYVVFKTAESLKKALKCTNLPPVSIKRISSMISLSKWAKEYNSIFIDPVSVQKEIDDYMADYDNKVEEKKRKAQEMESVADEDGWITITKHSKKPKISRSEAVSKKIIEKQKRENAKKSLLNFYRCQLRESKMEHLLELRKKFEKDKERIAQMKANRKFKPF